MSALSNLFRPKQPAAAAAAKPKPAAVPLPEPRRVGPLIAPAAPVPFPPAPVVVAPPPAPAPVAVVEYEHHEEKEEEKKRDDPETDDEKEEKHAVKEEEEEDLMSDEAFNKMLDDNKLPKGAKRPKNLSATKRHRKPQLPMATALRKAVRPGGLKVLARRCGVARKNACIFIRLAVENKWVTYRT